MLTFERIFDVRRLEPFIRGFTRNESAQVHVKVLGQEKNGDSLFLFDCQSLVTSATIIHIGVYGQATGQCKVVYSSECSADVVSCTINQSHTLLLFTEHQPAEARRKSSNYSLYVANLLAPQKTKTLKFQRPYHIEPHFIYGSAAEKTSRALVLVHTECVRLYHFPGEGEKAASSEYTEVFKAHEWYQWQPSVQCLFLVYPSAGPAATAARLPIGRQPSLPSLPLPDLRRSESPSLSPSDDLNVDKREQIRSYLVGIAFNDKFAHRRMFEIGISLPPATGLTREYDHGLLSDCVPDRKLNARVLTFSSGNAAFCSQVSGSISAHLEPDAVEYVITSVLHGHSLTVRVPHISTSLQKYPQVFFASYYDYVLVYLPGNFVHLIDVNCHLDMTYHVISNSKQFKCCHRTEGRCGRLSSFSNGSTVEFYDPSEGCAYNAKLSEQALLDLFCSTHSQLIRAAILRMALLYYDHSGMVAKIIRLLRNDTGSPEVQILLAEYIFGSAYREVKRHLNALSGCALPFTVADVFKNERIRVRSRDSSKVRLQYTHEGNVSYYDQQRHASCDRWWLSCNSQLLARGCCGRLPFRSIFRRVDIGIADAGLSVKGGKSIASGGSEKKKNRFLGKLMGLISHKHQTMQQASERLQERLTAGSASPTTSHLEAYLGIDGTADTDRAASGSSVVTTAETAALLRSIPALLSGSEGKRFLNPAPDSVLHRMIELLEKKLANVASALAVVNSEPTTVTDALTEYVSVICQKLQELPVLLWSQSGLTLTDDLTLRGQRQDILTTFQMFERYYAAVCDLGLPVSRGFTTVFAVLGYHALTPRVFLQYLDSGIISLNNIPEQWHHVLRNGSNGSSQNSSKCPSSDGAVLAQCISRLSEEPALRYCHLSEVPWAVQHLGEHILNSCVAINGSWFAKLPPNSSRTYSADGSSTSGTADSLDYAAHDSYQMLLSELRRLQLDENLLVRAAFVHIRGNSERAYAQRERSRCRPAVRASTP